MSLVVYERVAVDRTAKIRQLPWMLIMSQMPLL
jgi:hypothetical protein